MEIPSPVSIFSPILEIKGKPGTLVAVSDSGYYEVHMEVNGNMHTILFPVSSTVVMLNEPLPQVRADFEIER